MVLNYGKALKGEAVPGEERHNWYDEIPIWARITILAALGLLLSMIILALVIFCCRRNQGYTMGHRSDGSHE